MKMICIFTQFRHIAFTTDHKIGLNAKMDDITKKMLQRVNAEEMPLVLFYLELKGGTSDRLQCAVSLNVFYVRWI